MWSILCDFDDATQRRTTLAHLVALRGRWRLTLTPFRVRRTDAQNAYYWAVIVELFYEFLRAQDWSISSPTDAHEILKSKFLTVDVVHPQTGETIGQRVRSTTELNVEQMSDYLERCRHWLQEFFGLVLPDAEVRAHG